LDWGGEGTEGRIGAGVLNQITPKERKISRRKKRGETRRVRGKVLLKEMRALTGIREGEHRKKKA